MDLSLCEQVIKHKSIVIPLSNANRYLNMRYFLLDNHMLDFYLSM